MDSLGDARDAQHRRHGKQPATDGIGRQPHPFERVCTEKRAAIGIAKDDERDHTASVDSDPRLSDVELDVPPVREHERVPGVARDAKPLQKRRWDYGIGRPGVDQRRDRLESLSRGVADLDRDTECSHALTVHLPPSV